MRTRRLVVVVAIVAIVLGIVARIMTNRNFPTSHVRRTSTRGYEAAIATIREQQRDNSRTAPAWAPGNYMAGRRPDNSSFCRWYHGLPDYLSYAIDELTGTPESDDRGPYRILPFVIRGNDEILGDKDFPKITLCTHATADQVYNIVEIVRRWEGPGSLAVFAPGLDAGLAVALLDRACRCEPEMSKLSVHLVFPAGRPPALIPIIHHRDSPGDCAASDLQWREADTERKLRGMTYPINVARNVARNLASTFRVLVSDIELLPSAKLASGFLGMIDDRPIRNGVVFVVPTFEINSHVKPPSNKTELIEALRNGLAVYFHRFVCTHCQRFPGIARWTLRPDPGRVRPLIVTRREYPHHRWEPVFIGTREDPMYNEDMSWEGRQDKMAQMLEMCLMNYRLIILDGAFLVHTPGIKRKPSRSSSRTEIRSYDRVQEKRNSRIYQTVTRRLLNQYPVNRRCKQ